MVGLDSCLRAFLLKLPVAGHSTQLPGAVIDLKVSQMPTEARTVPLDLAQKLMLGRLHQSGLFEQLLSAELAQRYLCCVSRSHLEIMPSSPKGSFEVTNLSANPIAISGPKLGKGEKATLRPGTCIDFIGTHSDGSGQTVVYLKLKLQSRDQPRSQREHSGGEARSPEKPPTEPLLEALGGAEGRRAPAESSRKASAPFWLELGGSAVRQTFPDNLRILEGSSDGLLVGRAHQQSLHQEAFRKEVREYLSRDHFRIDRERAGQFNLVALSANPIWRMRQRQLRELERGDPPLSLLHGDEIFLFTGASDCTPDGPENLGVLKWRFVQAGDRAAHDPVVENDTIRSMRRPSQPSDRGRQQGHPLGGSLFEKEKNRYMPGFPLKAMCDDGEGDGDGQHHPQAKS
ncbi:unnamed protein product [Symbiodinium microadriaticum]|nr:unnamed protein product [Symbiodinium microadriaticum]